jgi:hypothetical protein
MTRLDAWAMQLTEQLAHWLQVWTGILSFQLCQLCLTPLASQTAAKIAKGK